MDIELLGWIALVFGLLSMIVSHSFAIWVSVVFTVFSASAGIILTGFGGAPIIVPYVFMLFGFLICISRFGMAFFVSNLFETKVGIQLVSFSLFALITALVLPRIFQDEVQVYWPVRGNIQGAALVVLLPLAPREGNVTQSIYVIGTLFSFGIMFNMLMRSNGARYFLNAMLSLATANILSAIIDIATYATDTADTISFIRNSSYAFIAEDQIGIFKRVIGFFSEAAAFGAFNMQLFPFLLSLFSSGVRRELTAPLTFATLILLFLSTSTTAYVSFMVYMFVGGAPMILDLIRRKFQATIVIGFTVLVVFVVATQYISTIGALSDVGDLFDNVLFYKSYTASSMERGNWNLQAWQCFIETFGLGVGLGSTRASSFPLVLLSNVGLIGTVLFGAFIHTLMRSPIASTIDPLTRAVGQASRQAILGGLIAATISGAVMDLGLLFYFCAAGAARAVTAGGKTAY